MSLKRTKGLKKTRKPVDQEAINKMREFFLSIWKTRTHHSEVSGIYLGSEPLSTYFHHIMPKKSYPNLMYEEANIILLTLDEHTNVENDMYRYEIINDKRDYLIFKFNL